jgi:bifunctional DNA-binding transcriptional regulator/antitoxin component of YhaV-PrlF toxin-antitoxin module
MSTAVSHVETIEMSEDGTLVLPPAVREALKIRGCERFSFVVDAEMGSVTLWVYDDEEWLYTPENQASLEAGLADVRAGRVRPSSEEELRRLAPCD